MFNYTFGPDELASHWLGYPVETVDEKGTRIGGRLVGYQAPADDNNIRLQIEPFGLTTVRPGTKITATVYWPGHLRRPIQQNPPQRPTRPPSDPAIHARS